MAPAGLRCCLSAMGKGLGGGYQPIAAVIASDRVVDTIVAVSGVFQHGHLALQWQFSAIERDDGQARARQAD